MAIPHSLVAPQGLSSGRASAPRVLLATLLCVFLVVFTCGYYLRVPSLSTSLLLREGVPNDREIEFESSVAQRQGAKATLSPVPTHVLTMFERALDEQKHDLDAQPLEGDYMDNTLSMHRDAESKVMQLACKITPASPKCKLIAAALAARAAAKSKAINNAKSKILANQAQAKLSAERAKAKLMAEQAKAIAQAVAKATAATNAKLKAAQEEIAKAKKEAARAKKEAADQLKAAKAEADAKIKAAEAKAKQASQKAPAVKSAAQKKAPAAASSKSKSK